MVLVVIALIIVAYVVGWQWGDLVSAIVWEAIKWVGSKIAEGFKKLWGKIFKKNIA